MLNVVLLEPEMPANTGNIGRTCCATGTRLHLIEPMGFKVNDKTLKRAGLDYWDKLDVIIYDCLEDFLEKNKEADAGMLWEQAFCKRKREILLGKEEQEILLSLARSLLLETDHTQVAKIYFMQLEDTIKRAMEEKKEKQKLYGTVSILFGLFLVIMLL